jgi:hypothetical protein
MPRRYPWAHMFCTRTNQPTSAQMTWAHRARVDHGLAWSMREYDCPNVRREVIGILLKVSKPAFPTRGSSQRILPGSDAKFGMVDRIEMDISFAGELSEEQRSRLLEIAGSCPVHRTFPRFRFRLGCLFLQPLNRERRTQAPGVQGNTDKKEKPKMLKEGSSSTVRMLRRAVDE